MPLPSAFSALLLTASVLAIIMARATPSPCDRSAEPELCRSVITGLGSTFGPYDFGIHAVTRSLETARSTVILLTRVGASTGKTKPSAIDDCLELVETSADDLETASAELAAGESALTRRGVDRVRTMVSSALTNVNTCLYGLEEEESRGSEEIYETMHEVSRMYGVTLTLVASAMDRVVSRWPARSPTSIQPAKFRPGVLNGIIDAIPANRTVTVAKDGSANFTLIMDAVKFAPENASSKDGYFKIVIKEGVYKENVVIGKTKRGLIVIGAGINRTVVTENRSVAKGWKTCDTATFVVLGERFIAHNLTFENTAGPANKQAVAVRNDADLSIFYKCSFLGYQDTLYLHHNRQFYRDCDIYGTIDFIFGNAAAVLQNCNIYARKPLSRQSNTITAQSRSLPDDKTGISIHNCSIRAAPDLQEDPNSTKTYLGRPWEQLSTTVIMQSFLDALIEPEGWLEWDGRRGLDTLYYGEYENKGPGADTRGRVQWRGYRPAMNETDAYNFTVFNFISGEDWLWNTSVPFVPGLL